jgi:hypothetical protein
MKDGEITKGLLPYAVTWKNAGGEKLKIYEIQRSK